MVMASKQISYLSGLGDSFIEGLHTDLELISEEGFSLKAHRVILVKRLFYPRKFVTIIISCKDVSKDGIYFFVGCTVFGVSDNARNGR